MTTWTREPPKVSFEGDVQTYWGYPGVHWQVFRVERSGSEERDCKCLASGTARSMHGAKSIIAKMCKRFATIPLDQPKETEST